MELPGPVFSEQDRDVQWRGSRRYGYGRASMDLRTVVADQAGLASGQVIDLTTRGCGLRLAKPLRCGQHLTLKLYPGDGTAAMICDLVKVQWVNEERAGVAFLSMSLENELRLHRLCGDRLTFECED